VAFHALTDEKSHNNDHRVLGPELLTYDQVQPCLSTLRLVKPILTVALQVAAKLSSALGRKVEHVKLTEEQKFQSLVKVGLPEHFAKFLAHLEVSAAGGEEQRMNDTVDQVTGRPPKTFDTFAQENKAVWQ
jgi:hypothetical protein